jgi:hypothetical protein
MQNLNTTWQNIISNVVIRDILLIDYNTESVIEDKLLEFIGQKWKTTNEEENLKEWTLIKNRALFCIFSIKILKVLILWSTLKNILYIK